MGFRKKTALEIESVGLFRIETESVGQSNSKRFRHALDESQQGDRPSFEARCMYFSICVPKFWYVSQIGFQRLLLERGRTKN